MTPGQANDLISGIQHLTAQLRLRRKKRTAADKKARVLQQRVRAFYALLTAKEITALMKSQVLRPETMFAFAEILKLEMTP